MTSRKSFSKYGTWMRQIMAQNIWVVVLSLIGFLSVLPLYCALLLSNVQDRLHPEMQKLKIFQEMLSFTHLGVQIVFLAMAIVAGVSVFGYLYSKKKVDFYHSLPVTRLQWFWVRYLAGLLMVVPAYLLGWAMVAGIASSAGFSVVLSSTDIWFGVLSHIIFFWILYSITVLCTILCGNTVIALLLFLWAVFSPSLFFLESSAIASAFYPTFVRFGVDLETLALHVSPVLSLFTFHRHLNYILETKLAFDASDIRFLLSYMVVIILLILLARWLFVRRASEKTHCAVAFSKFQLPFKLWCVLLLSMSNGLLFFLLTDGVSKVWFLVGWLFGTIWSHMLLEILYHFDIKAYRKHMKTILVCLGFGVLVVVCLWNDILGYNRYLPKEDQIQGVNIGYFGNDLLPYYPTSGTKNLEDTMLQDRKNVQLVRLLAEKGIEAEKDVSEDTINYAFQIVYRLKSGRMVWRKYDVPLQPEQEEAFKQEIAKILYSEEYIMKNAPAFTMDLTGNERMRIEDPTHVYGDDVLVEVKNTEIMDQIIKAAREDSLTLTFAEAQNSAPVLRIDVVEVSSDEQQKYTGENYLGHIYIYPSFQKTLQVLQKNTGIIPASILSKDVAHVYLEKQKETSIKIAVTNLGDIQKVLQYAIPSAMVPPSLEIADLSEGNSKISIVVELINGESFDLEYPKGKEPLEILQKYGVFS